jgi:glyoxylase-like metal-dependent hydrolase (beta-lactamase superfamily II)
MREGETAMTGETFRFHLGSFECVAIHDGDASYTADKYFANAPSEELDRALRAHAVDPAHIPSPYSGLVINTGAHRVLVDTGAGSFAPGLGRLRANLLAKGIEPETIDTVILTHGHPDHLGGNTDGAGNVVFRNARHVISRD